MSETGPAKPKRFYKDAQLVSLEAGYAVHLDGKPVRTPMGKLLIIPVQALGEAVVGEWQAQGDAIDPASMPLCGYANTAIDRVGKDRQTVFDNLMYFAGSDLLCYRADQPDDLVKRQSENWQPVLDWVTR